MTYTLRILTAESRDLVVEALRSEASKRARVAQRAAVELAPDRAARKDVRAASVRVTDLLAEAGRLDQLADELAAAQDVPVVATTITLEGNVTPAQAAATIAGLKPGLTAAELDEAAIGTDVATGEAVVESDPEDDGLSPAARAAAALAGLDDARLDEDDPTLDTGATAEDDPELGLDEDTRARIAEADAAIIDGAIG